MLLEDVIRFNLPAVFSYFGYNKYESWVFKVTRDAEIDIDNDVATSLMQKLETGIKNRKRGKPVRFVFDKEMDAGLLEYLMRNPERVVSKAMILSHVFDYSFDPRTNVVDVLVHRLREKVDKEFATPMIHTVRGMGYVLRPA